MTEDCLLVNESIEGIADFSAVMENSRLEVCFTVETMYGDLVFSDLAVDVK